MRVVLFTGKGGVGKTTAAAATALRLAEHGLKTLLLSTDSAHSLADAVGLEFADDSPTEIVDGLFGVQLDSQRRFEAAWGAIQRYLVSLIAQGGVDPIVAEELTLLPGVDEVLSLLAIREYAIGSSFDAIIVDCAPTAETLRLLALPEALSWYVDRVLPLHRQLARGLRPLAGLLARGDALPPDGALEALVRLTDDLRATRALLTDPATTSVRLVMTPEAVVTAETRRTFTALSLYAYRVDGVIVNRVFPQTPDASSWQRRWQAAQAAQLAEIAESFCGLPLRTAAYLAVEPVGVPTLRELASDLYGELPGIDPVGEVELPVLLDVSPDVSAGVKHRYVLSMYLPGAEVGNVTAARSGDELIVTVGGRRRLLTLPSVLRRCEVSSGQVREGRLMLRFRPDPALWPGG
jgi:arsenite-transporting ATPase